MKVAMASYRFNYRGGIERASYELATRLAGTGHDVTLVAHDAEPAPRPPMHWDRVPMPPHPAQLVPLLFSRAATRRLDHDTFDIVHNQGGCALRRQHVITAHSCHRAWWELKKLNGESARAYLNPHHHAILRVEAANYRPGAFARVIAVSAGVKQEIMRYYDVPDDLITVVPNGVDLQQFRPIDRDAIRTRLRKEHGFADDDVVLLFVGKEFRRKGLRPIIDALPHLPEHARLLVVGGDAQAPFREAAQEAGVSDRIVFAGHCDDVQDQFQAADVFVFPTLYEAFALVTLEAAAAGLPLVTTAVNGTEDFVEDGVNGVFVTRDPASIAAALGPLVGDRQLREQMGARAAASVQAYTWDEVTRRTCEVYEQVLASEPGR